MKEPYSRIFLLRTLGEMSFKEIERVLGERLPESAYKYPALWSNSESHSIAFGWMDAGYMSQSLNIANQTVENDQGGRAGKFH